MSATSPLAFAAARARRGAISPGTIVPVVILLALIGTAAYVLIEEHFATQRVDSIGSGTIEVDDADLGSRVGGRIAKVFVKEGDFVEANAPLVEFENTRQVAALAQAEALLAQREADLARLQGGFRPQEIAAVRARYEQAVARLDELRAGPRKETIDAQAAEVQALVQEYQRAVDEAKRHMELEREGLSTTQTVENLQTARDALQARLNAARERLRELQAGTRPEQIQQAEAVVAQARAEWNLQEAGFRAEDIAAAKAAVEAARAAVALARDDLDETLVKAPAAGAIEMIEVLPGDLVAGNQTVVRMVFRERTYLRAFVPEKFLGYLDVGHDVQIGLTAAPQLGRIKGTVVAVSNAGEYTPRNTQTPDERARIVYEVKVLVGESLRAGMAANLYLPAEQMQNLQPIR